MTRVFIKTRVNCFFLSGGDILLWVAQIFKWVGRVQRTITTLEDWSLPRPTDSVFDRLNKLKILFNDYMLNHMETTVIVMPKMIYDWRNDYWQNKTLRNSILQDHKWAWFLAPTRTLRTFSAKSICLLGTVRENFGFEMLLELLPELNHEFGIRLKVIGLDSPLYRKFKALADQSLAAPFIDWKGFVPLVDLEHELEDCFCGVNLQERRLNNSAGIVPGRIVHYLQNLLVPIVTDSSGGVVDLLQSHGVGIICRAEVGSVKQAIRQAFIDNSKLAGNIDEFLRTNPYRVEAKNILDL